MSSGAAASAEPAPTASARQVVAPRPADEVEPLDLGSAGGAALAAALGRQAVPVVAALLGLLIGWLIGIRSAHHDVTKRS